MTDTMKLNMSLSLPFESAGVEFRINVADDNGAASFSLTAACTGTGAPMAFVSDVSPVLADWVRGYTRWLYRCRISATHTDDAITGSFERGLDADQILEGLRLACDMIRQRFELYEGSVVVD